MCTACRQEAGQWFKAVVTLAWVHREGPTEQGPPKPCFHAPRRPLPLPKVLVPRRGHRCQRTHPSVARSSPAPVHLHVADSSSQGERGTPPPSLAHSMALARRLLVTGDPHAAARCRWVLPRPPPSPPWRARHCRSPGPRAGHGPPPARGARGQAHAIPRYSADRRCHTDIGMTPPVTRGVNGSAASTRPGPVRPHSVAPCSLALRPTCAVLAAGCTCVIGYCVGTGGTPVGNAGKTPGANDTAGGTMLGTP